MMNSDLMQDSRISRLVELALIEDIGLGDLTTEALISETSIGHAEILCKESGIIAGLEVASLVFTHCDRTITLEPVIWDGGRASGGDIVARVNGRGKGILTAERTALNFIQRMSGVATLTGQFVGAVEGTGATITDTRKTVPGLRVLDKLAVRLGGGTNHRFGLDDMVIIKDNHVVAAGGIRRAVQVCREHLESRKIHVPLEVETKDLEEVLEVLGCEGVSRIMLDNFSLPDMRRAVELIGGRVEVEASGGITLDTVRSYAETGVDFISIGALTHSARALDLSLELTSHV
jgi:nicotinate-nucleotide pyrophosphorylase (carboxylating)